MLTNPYFSSLLTHFVYTIIYWKRQEYELGDLTVALDTMSKELTCELTGKDDYEFGDLSKEIDSRVKNAVAEFCSKDVCEFFERGRVHAPNRLKNEVL